MIRHSIKLYLKYHDVPTAISSYGADKIIYLPEKGICLATIIIHADVNDLKHTSVRWQKMKMSGYSCQARKSGQCGFQ